MTVTADLSTPGGWHSTVPLAGPATFTGNDYEGSVLLDLPTLEAKALAASAITGLTAGPVTIALTPEVTTMAGADFQPKLNLNLTMQLTLTGAPDTLTVTDTTTKQQTDLSPRRVGLNGAGITAATGRVVSAVLLLAALAVGSAPAEPHAHLVEVQP